jgi:hypothetical protein
VNAPSQGFSPPAVAAVVVGCPTCGAPQAGNFCATCGQRFRSGRISLRQIASEVLSELIALDRGLPHTAIALFRRPGSLIRDYLAGATHRVTGPAKYLLICAAIGAIVYLQLGWLKTDVGGLSGLSAIAREHLSLLLIARVPVAALLTVVLFRRAGFNLAEHLVFNAYATAQSLLLLALTAPVALLGIVPMELYAGLLVLGAVAYYTWAAVDLFRIHLWGDVLRAAAVQGIVILLYLLVLGFGTGAL